MPGTDLQQAQCDMILDCLSDITIQLEKVLDLKYSVSAIHTIHHVHWYSQTTLVELEGVQSFRTRVPP